MRDSELIPPLILLVGVALAGIALELTAPDDPVEIVAGAPRPTEPGSCRGICLVP